MLACDTERALVRPVIRVTARLRYYADTDLHNGAGAMSLYVVQAVSSRE